MASMSNIKVALDISDINKIVRLRCMSINCKHNTANTSHGESIGLCNMKYICLSESGACLSIDPATKDRKDGITTIQTKKGVRDER